MPGMFEMKQWTNCLDFNHQSYRKNLLLYEKCKAAEFGSTTLLWQYESLIGIVKIIVVHDWVAIFYYHYFILLFMTGCGLLKYC